jgi:hypothetical protein
MTQRGRRRLSGLATALAIAAAIAASAPAPASALVPAWQQMTADQQENIARYVACGWAKGPICPNEGPADYEAARRVWLNEHARVPATAPGPSTAAEYERLQSKTTTFRQKAGALPRWGAWVGKTINVGAAASLGVMIGNGINNKFLHFGLNTTDPLPGVSEVKITTVTKGTPAGDPLAPSAPYDGWRVQITRGALTDGFWYQPPGGGLHFEHCQLSEHPGPGSIPAGFTEMAGSVGGCTYAFDEFNNPIREMYQGVAAYSRQPGLQMVPLTRVPDGNLPADTPLVNYEQAPTGNNDEVPSDYPTLKQRVADAWDDTSDPEMNEIRESIWHNAYPELHDGPDPLAGTGTVSSCRGGTYADCVQALREDGFLGTITELEVPPEGADLEILPEGVIATNPPAGAEVSLETEIEVETNPDAEHMPKRVPAPNPGETAQSYKTRLAALGLAGLIVLLTPETLDPSVGPNEVSRTQPEVGSRVNPGTEVKIFTNPPEAPPVPGGGSSCAPPTIRSINFNPLNVAPGAVFPFGIFGWLAELFDDWLRSVQAPEWHFALTNSIEWEVSFAFLNPLMSVVRPAMLVVSFLGVAWMLATAALKIGPQPDE